VGEAYDTVTDMPPDVWSTTSLLVVLSTCMVQRSGVRVLSACLVQMSGVRVLSACMVQRSGVWVRVRL
jgi:hypothetical protein